MTKWDLYFRIRGPGGVIEAPNKANPVGPMDLASLLAALADRLPELFGGAEIVGVRIEMHRDAIPVPAPQEEEVMP